MRLTQEQQAAKRNAAARLGERLRPGAKVYTVLRSVARSGLSRRISAFVLVPNESGECEMVNIGRDVALVLDLRYDTQAGAVKVSGCGMDMGFWLVYGLSFALFPQGFDCYGRDCNSNDHSNGDRDYEPHHHRDGGYALRHSWA